MKHNNCIILVALLFSTASFGQTSATAITANKVNIKSNSFSVDSKAGAIHHTGDVVMQYGAFLIEAQAVSEYKNKDLFEKAIAVGSPAIFQQLAGADREFVSASGAEIVFINNATEQSIEIKGNAFLQQAGISATCNQLKILLDKGVVQNIDGSGGESQCQIVSDNQSSDQPQTSEPADTAPENSEPNTTTQEP